MVPLIPPLIASLLSNTKVWLNNSYAIALVVIGIGFLVFIHELGHFVVAKWAGVKVEMFSIGFGPTLISWRKGFGLRRGSTVREYNTRIAAADDDADLAKVLEKYGETEYSIRVLPLGGFVAWLGEDPTEPDGKSRDPRAFHKKPVGSRMAIVSAGVVMNLIFGVLCNTWIHYKGKPEAPAVIGMVAAGTPAYIAGIRPGDEVVAIDGRTDISFQSIKEATQLSHAGQSIKFDIKRPGQEKPIRVEIEPKRSGNNPAPAIGVTPSESLELGGKTPEGLLGYRNEKREYEYDRVTAAGPIGSKPIPVNSIFELNTILARERSKSMVIVAERGSLDDRETKPKSVIEVTIPPKPIVDFGFWLTMGPIKAIQGGSPAKAAGFQIGDRIISIDGVTSFDPLSVQELFAAKAGIECVVQVQRGNDASAPKIIVRVVPDDSVNGGEAMDVAEPMKVPAVGLAIEIEPKVFKVVDDSAASKSGIMVGMVLSTAQFESKDAPAELQKPLVLDNKTLAWSAVIDAIQNYSGSVKLTFGNNPISITPAIVEDRFDISRGLQFMTLVKVHAPERLTVALRKGGEDTWETATTIVRLVRSLGSGRVGLGGLAGPLGIGKLAYKVAQNGGMTDLLPLLGFLSINLAVMNFFPIPPLDGGQMLFLIAEKVRGRPLPDNAVLYPMLLGGVLILVLFVLISAKEIWSLVGNLF